ncbi:MAG: IPExxxVDY family protein [Cytophagia bacterium]|nr:IPExxxVDY family protein [Cytophagia bacterium]
MKKTKLVVDYDFDFVLLGLASSFKGYKLAWELNNSLGLHLVKKEDILMGFKGNIERSFSCHVHQTNTRFIRLIRNKPQETDGGKYFLAPEYPHLLLYLWTLLNQKRILFSKFYVRESFVQQDQDSRYGRPRIQQQRNVKSPHQRRC